MGRKGAIISVEATRIALRYTMVRGTGSGKASFVQNIGIVHGEGDSVYRFMSKHVAKAEGTNLMSSKSI